MLFGKSCPAIEDGLKPVQRDSHSMKDLDDGRFNKVANIVGLIMQYHPMAMQVFQMRSFRSTKSY